MFDLQSRWQAIRTVFTADFRIHMRDRITIILVFLIPCLLYPLLLGGTQSIQEKTQERQQTSEIRIKAPEAVQVLSTEEDHLIFVTGELPKGSQTEEDRDQTKSDQTPLAEITLSPSKATILYRGDKRKGSLARNRAHTLLERYTKQEQEDRWKANQLPFSPEEIIQLEDTDLADNQEKQGQLLGKWIPFFLIIT